MTIDYDRLRELVDETPPGPWEVEEFEEQYAGCPPVTKFYLGSDDMQNIAVAEATERYYDQTRANFDLIALAPDMARELLRLHGGIEVIRDYCAGNARSARAAGMHTLANEMYATVKALAELLEGDTE